MKILHIGESTRGGCGTYLNEIVPLQLRMLGQDQVRCLVPRQHTAQLCDIPAHALRTFERPGRAAGLPRLAAGIVSALREWRPDLVHAHSTFAGAAARMLSLAWPMPPVVYCPHGWVFEVEQPRAARAAARTAERLLSRLGRRIVAISEAERRQGEEAGIQRDRMTVVYNGINAESGIARAAWDEARLKVLFVGRLDRQKGVDVLLEAVRPLGAQLSVRVVGEQVLSGAPRPAGAGPDCGEHVEFLGWRDRDGVTAQINACDVVVMPSRWEGFGLVAVEAMRAAKPVIASAIGGLTEIVVEGVTGHLVRPDDPVALAAALLRNTSRELARMGAAGRARFLERYTSDRTHEGLLRVYESVLQKPARAAVAVRRGSRTVDGTP